MKLLPYLLLILALTVQCARADTPPPGTVRIKDSAGNSIATTGSALNVNVSGGTCSVTGSVSISNFPGTQPVSGTFWQATQPVSAASLPLPAGASTSALQSTANSSLSSIDSKLGGTLAVDGSGHTQPVSGTFWQATQPVSAASLPLPSGAATATNQATANSSLSSLDGKLPAKGQAAMANSVPVAIASDQGAIPISGSITATNIANGPTGSAVPAQATQVGGSDGTNLRAIKVSSVGVVAVDASGTTVPVSGTFWQATQPVSAAVLPLPSGASTAANQATGNSSLSSIDSKLSGTLAVSAASLPLPAGAATSAKQPALGTAGTASSDVITVQGVASMTALKVDGSAVIQPVSGTFWQATQPVSAASLPLPSGASTSANQATANTSLSSIDGKVPANLTVTSTRLLVDGSGVTQPVSASSLPLPSGASTASKQPALGTAGSASSDVITVQGIASMTALKVDGSAVTQPVSAASLPLPSGAATSANQATANTSLSSIDGKVPANLTVSSTRLLVDGSGVTQPVSVASAIPTKAPVNANGSMSTNTSVGNGAAVTLTAPANAVGFILEASSANAQNIRWAVGTTPTTSSGLRLEPGRDTGYVPAAANVQVIAEAGSSQEVQIQWVLSQ